MRNNGDTVVRWESKSKPAFGGISFYILFLLSIIGYSIVFEQSAILLNTNLLGLITAVTLAFLMGLADDAYNTIPLLKFSTQVCCGIILIYTDTYISVFTNMYLNYALTVIWIIAIMNSMNLLDNMDGIASVVSVFVILAAILIIYLQNDFTNIYLLLLIGTLSALLGFLKFNWYPSKMYMGDTGSQFLGIFLGVIGIVYFWNNMESPVQSENIIESGTTFLSASKNFILALLVFIIPIIDTSTVVINRIGKGQSPFIGGKDHTTHHLYYLGLSNKKIAFLFMGISGVSLFLVLLIVTVIEEWSYFHFLIFASYFIIVFGLLYYSTRITNGKSTEELQD